jgi:hypothetical protein
MKLGFSGQIFEKYSHIKFHEIASSGSRADGQTDRDRKKLTVAFRNFANAPKNANFCVIAGGTCINH